MQWPRAARGDKGLAAAPRDLDFSVAHSDKVCGNARCVMSA